MVILLKTLLMSFQRKLLPVLFVCCLLFTSCRKSEENLIPAASSTLKNSDHRTLTNDFKDYWFSGKAEITSYKLSQERYGELRNGTAMTIFVTEEFQPDTQVKANQASSSTIPVLKLNQTKKYITGIYPYSVMTSTFSPLPNKAHALKVSHTMQEWCGHVYVQLNNKKNFEIESHSYFDGEADQRFELDKTWIETELWNLIRINPEELPTGSISVIPSFEFSRTGHQKLKEVEANAHLMKGDSLTQYTLTYPTLKRELRIYFHSEFPYEIEQWEETNPNGLITKAEKMKRMKTAYWSQNGTEHEALRDSLLLN